MNADCCFIGWGIASQVPWTPALHQISFWQVARWMVLTWVAVDQGDATHFLQRFALQTHAAFDPLASMKFSLEHQNPFVTGPVSGGAAYPALTYSFLSISNPNVLLWALKPHEEGIAQGIVARLWNFAPTTESFTLRRPSRSIQSAQIISLSDPISAANVSAGAHRNDCPTSDQDLQPSYQRQDAKLTVLMFR
jgi:hypothetical protein